MQASRAAQLFDPVLVGFITATEIARPIAAFRPLIKAYETEGERELATGKLGKFLMARYGSVNEGKAQLGDLPVIREAFKRMQAGLYAS